MRKAQPRLSCAPKPIPYLKEKRKKEKKEKKKIKEKKTDEKKSKK